MDCRKGLHTEKGCFSPRRLDIKRKTIHGREVRLQCEAMKSILLIEDELKTRGIPLVVVSSYRTCKEQAAIYNSGVRPAARPGESYHNIGLAVDLYFKPSWLKEIRAAFKRHNWNQFDKVNDPGHFTYRVTG